MVWKRAAAGGRRLLRLIQSLFRKPAKAPNPVTDINGVVSMKTVNLSWKLPTTRVGGAPLADTDIAYTVVEIAVEGGGYTELAKVPAPESRLTVPDLEPGTWVFRFTVVDKQAKPKTSAQVVYAVVVPVPEFPAPEVVTDIGHTLS